MELWPEREISIPYCTVTVTVIYPPMTDGSMMGVVDEDGFSDCIIYNVVDFATVVCCGNRTEAIAVGMGYHML